MSRYLIVAHQTATSPELRREITRILEVDPAAEFGVIVPAGDYSARLLVNEDAARVAALKRADDARAMLGTCGAAVWRTDAGCANAFDALSDELRDHPGYDEIVLSTLQPGVSRWIRQDLPHKAQRFGLPVRHVVSRQRAPAYA